MALVYPGGLASTDFEDGEVDSGYEPWNYYYGSSITLGSAGTVTQLGAKCRSTFGNLQNFKIGLYNSGGTLLVQSTFTTTSTSLVWLDSGTISQAVSSGKHYILLSQADYGGDVGRYGFDTSGTGSTATGAYASAMASSATIAESEASTLVGVRMDFTAGASQSQAPRSMHQFRLRS